MQAVKAKKVDNKKEKLAHHDLAKGPSGFEVAYLKQLKDELEIFLRSKNFSTIQQFDIAFEGNDYSGHMKVGA